MTGDRAVVNRDRDVLLRLDTRLDRLLDDAHAPVTARRTWLQAWLDSYLEFTPLVVTVERAGELVAVAPLAMTRTAMTTLVVAMGHGPSDETRIVARDLASARCLARGVIETLEAFRPWRMHLRHGDGSGPAVRALQEALRWSRVSAGDVLPRLAFSDDRSPQTYLPARHRRRVNNLNNRLRREGRDVEIAHLRDIGDVKPALPEVRAVCRERDLQLRACSRLDQPDYSSFFDRVVLAHAETDNVLLTTMRVDGQLAAYSLVFCDGPAHRNWNTRVSPRWTSYSAGKICNTAAVNAAASDPQVRYFDWMRGEEDYKRPLSNFAFRATDLYATSEPALLALHDTTQAVRRGARWAAQRNRRLENALSQARLRLNASR